MQHINQTDDLLLSRTITNTGSNIVNFTPDERFYNYVTAHRKNLVSPFSLEPNESKKVSNMYMIIHTSDNEAAHLQFNFE